MYGLNGITASRSLLGIAALFTMSLALLQGRAALADDKMDASQLVEKAQLTLQNFVCDENMGAFRSLVQKADGVLIVPNLLKGAFMVGASGGSGVLVVRDQKGEGWTDPAFYTLGGASIGMQIGGQSSEVILLAMTDRGVKSFLSDSLKLGADVGLAAGPVGMGASAATANLSADVLTFSRSKGLFGGVSLDGAVVAVRHDLNAAYYGNDASTTDILITRSATRAEGSTLAEAVSRSASGRLAMSQCGMEEPRGAVDGEWDKVSTLNH